MGKGHLNILSIISLFIGWRLLLFIVTFYGLSIIPHYGNLGQLQHPIPDIDYFSKLTNWDGGHFRGIAENGYLPTQTPFFPLYPLLIKTLMLLGIPSLWGGLIISHSCALIGLFYLYKLVLFDFKKEVVWKVLFLLLIFPTSFYFGTVYSESLFFALVTAALYYARTGRWFLAFSLAGLTAVTRLIGVVVILAVASEYYLSITQLNFKHFLKNRIARMALFLILANIFLNLAKIILTFFHSWLLVGVTEYVSYIFLLVTIFSVTLLILLFFISKVDTKKIISKPTLYFLLSFLPLIFYMVYLNQIFHDPLSFITVEKSWQRQPTFPWDSIISYYQYISAQGFFRIGAISQSLIEFIFLVIFMGAAWYSLVKLRISYSMFLILSLLIPLSSGTLQAIHRYALVLFPLFIALAMIKNPIIYNLWIIFSLLFLGIFSVLFINSFWVT